MLNSSTASFSFLPGLKWGRHFSKAAICSPVFGLRDCLGGCFFSLKLPKPRISILLPEAIELDNISMSLIYGIQAGFYSGDVANILDDMRVLKPTVLAIVPRILNKIYGDIQA